MARFHPLPRQPSSSTPSFRQSSSTHSTSGQTKQPPASRSCQTSSNHSSYSTWNQSTAPTTTEPSDSPVTSQLQRPRPLLPNPASISTPPHQTTHQVCSSPQTAPSTSSKCPLAAPSAHAANAWRLSIRTVVGAQPAANAQQAMNAHRLKHTTTLPQTRHGWMAPNCLGLWRMVTSRDG